MQNIDPKPTVDEIGATLVIITLMRYPPPEAVHALIFQELQSFVGKRSELIWLNEQLLRRVNDWPGLPQLRALFCTHFPPADGFGGPPCAIPGYTPADGEAKYIAIEAQRGVNLLPKSDRMQRLLAGEVEPPSSEDDELAIMVRDIAKAKAMPETPQTRLAARNRIKDLLQ